MEQKKLYKANKDKMLDGVCAGMAEYFDMDPTVMRLLWVLVSLVGGSAVLAYIICMFVIPRKPANWIE